MWRTFAGPAILCLLVSAQAQENVPLKPGTGLETVEANCGACHSLDYPRINAPFLKRQGWEAVVNKTINGLQRADQTRRRQGHHRLSHGELWQRRLITRAQAVSVSAARAPLVARYLRRLRIYATMAFT